MGTIQNSLNQALGSVGTAAAISKHLSEEEKSNALTQAKEIEKAIPEYQRTTEEFQKLEQEKKDLTAESKQLKNDPLLAKAKEIEASHEQGTNYKYNELVRDEEGNFYEPNEYIQRAEERMKKVKELKSANKYSANALRSTMISQDKKFDLLGIDREKEFGNLNDPKTHKKIRKFIEGGNL